MTRGSQPRSATEPAVSRRDRGSVLLGLVSLAMPAMTAVVVGAAGPE